MALRSYRQRGPTPMTPNATRSLGAACPSRPSARAGTMVGSNGALAAATKARREIPGLLFSRHALFWSPHCPRTSRTFSRCIIIALSRTNDRQSSIARSCAEDPAVPHHHLQHSKKIIGPCSGNRPLGGLAPMRSAEAKGNDLPRVASRFQLPRGNQTHLGGDDDNFVERSLYHEPVGSASNG
ncbi:MAG: hypothetical protein KatS3mg111_1536 [Pirellulaceae bacterium]|nr:MAG: hypothetical protein KatS3mg111_1536 [Pirellulaceae bacterium]